MTALEESVKVNSEQQRLRSIYKIVCKNQPDIFETYIISFQKKAHEKEKQKLLSACASDRNIQKLFILYAHLHMDAGKCKLT